MTLDFCSLLQFLFWFENLVYLSNALLLFSILPLLHGHTPLSHLHTILLLAPSTPKALHLPFLVTMRFIYRVSFSIN
jgi:hypothetical protein